MLYGGFQGFNFLLGKCLGGFSVRGNVRRGDSDGGNFPG